MENGNKPPRIQNQYPDTQQVGPFVKMLNEVRALATTNLQAIYELQKQYVEESANTLSTLLIGSVDTLQHMQDIWFSTEEFVTTLGRGIFRTTWGVHIESSDVINILRSLSPMLYWQPTNDLAQLMYTSSSRYAERNLLEYINYAKQHVLSESLRVIETTNSLSQAIQDLIDFYNRFSARNYFGDLQSRAFQVYEERRRQGATYHDELGDWLRAERERLKEHADVSVWR